MQNLQYVEIKVPNVKDAQIRMALHTLDGNLRAIFKLIGSLVSTDPEQGTQKMVAPVVIPDIGYNPTLQGTAGVRGQLVRFADGELDRFFYKESTSGDDTNWTELGSENNGITLYNQAAQPALATGPAWWYKPSTGTVSGILSCFAENESGVWEWVETVRGRMPRP